MPNWCSTEIAIYPATDTPKVEMQMSQMYNWLEETIRRAKKEKREFWAADLLDSLRMESKKYECRGTIESVDISQDGDYILVSQEDAWSPHTEFWEDILATYFPMLGYCYLAEECGNGVFINTDDTRQIFPQEYAVNYYPDELPEGVSYGEEGEYYYNSEKEMLEDWSKRTGRTFGTFQELWDFAANELDYQLSINKFESA